MLDMLVRRVFTSSPPWYQDLCEYYHVTSEQAEALGTRKPGRKPSLPGSTTTHAVSGLTFEEIWNQKRREDPQAIIEFYQDMGAWATFRQCYYHRYLRAGRFVQQLPDGGRFCEYGGGVAPILNWIVEHVRGRRWHLTVTDVPSEHLTFAEWRIKKKIAARQLPFTFEALPVRVNALPLQGTYDVIAILEVFEHLYNPLEVARHLTDHLKHNGLLWENYIKHDDADAADLQVAQDERPAVFEYLRAHYTRVSGADPEAPGGKGTRCWRKR